MATIRRAGAADAVLVTAIAQEAFAVYVGLIGDVRPWPMDLDYGEVISRGNTWVAEDDHGRVAGFVVLEEHEDHLLLDVIAVAAASQGSGAGHALMSMPTTWLARAGCPRSGSTPTR